MQQMQQQVKPSSILRPQSIQQDLKQQVTSIQQTQNNNSVLLKQCQKNETKIKKQMSEENKDKVQVSEQEQKQQQQQGLKRQSSVVQTPRIKKKVQQFCDGSIVFTIDQHYDIKKLIGSGIYGIVASGVDTKTNTAIAIKKISKLFNNFGDTKRVLRQIKVLQFLNHKNIISLKDIMSIENPSTFNQIYLCMEYMEFDLRRLIQSQTAITQKMIQYIMYQLLAAINFMHSADILHRDLKPENILMNKKCQLKLADMNLARKQIFVGKITDYVASRPYRAPQILIGSTKYTKSVDIWSIGCIFAQLLGKTIIFQGKDFIDQLKRFVAILGKPKVQYFPHIDKTSMESLAKLISQIPDKQKVEWKYLMPSISSQAADLLDHMLTYDASQRYTAEECLNHPYLIYYKNAPKVKCKQIFDFSFDNLELNEKALRKAICDATDSFLEQKSRYQKVIKNQNQNQAESIKKKIKPNQ